MDGDSKNFLTSKTLWANVLWIGTGFLRARFGFVMPPEMETLVLGAINMVLRFITKGPVTWA